MPKLVFCVGAAIERASGLLDQILTGKAQISEVRQYTMKSIDAFLADLPPKWTLADKANIHLWSERAHWVNWVHGVGAYWTIAGTHLPRTTVLPYKVPFAICHCVPVTDPFCPCQEGDASAVTIAELNDQINKFSLTTGLDIDKADSEPAVLQALRSWGNLAPLVDRIFQDDFAVNDLSNNKDMAINPATLSAFERLVPRLRPFYFDDKDTHSQGGRTFLPGRREHNRLTGTLSLFQNVGRFGTLGEFHSAMATFFQTEPRPAADLHDAALNAHLLGNLVDAVQNRCVAYFFCCGS